MTDKEPPHYHITIISNDTFRIQVLRDNIFNRIKIMLGILFGIDIQFNNCQWTDYRGNEK